MNRCYLVTFKRVSDDPWWRQTLRHSFTTREDAEKFIRECKNNSNNLIGEYQYSIESIRLDGDPLDISHRAYEIMRNNEIP